MTLVLLSLVSYRVWRLIAVDDMPFGPTRERLIKRWEGAGDRYVEGLLCPWCLGSLVSFALVGAVAQVMVLPLPGLWALGVACGCGLISKLDPQ